MTAIRRTWLAVLISAAPVAAARAQELAGPVAGGLVDLAEFGAAKTSEGMVSVEWETPRAVHEIHVTFPEGDKGPPADSLRLEWWGSIWPNTGQGGWQRVDDPWNGQWVRVDTKAVQGPHAGTWVFSFPPLTSKEWKEALNADEYPDKKAPTFRSTLKVRVASDGHRMPAGSRLTVLGRSRWREASFDIELRLSQHGRHAGRVEVTNGRLLSASALPTAYPAKLTDAVWEANGVPGGSTGLRVRLLYTDAGDARSNDLTRVTVRLGELPQAGGFSFVPQDVLGQGPMRLTDFGALVAETASRVTLTNDPGPGTPRWERTVRGRINERPEASYHSAMAGIPRLDPPQWVPLGVPCARQEVFVSPQGDWGMWGGSLHTDARDTERIPFRPKAKRRQDSRLNAILDTGPEASFNGADREGLVRYLEQGWLPMIHAEWRTGPICYHHALATTILFGEIGEDEKRRGDEPVVLLTRLELRNTARTPQAATVRLRYSHNAPLSLQDNGVIAITSPPEPEVPKGLTALRGIISVDQPAAGGAAGWTVDPAVDDAASPILRWNATLAPGETRRLYFKAPYVDLLDQPELERLQHISFEEEVPRNFNYWQQRLAAGMRVDLPEPALNRLYAANLWHNVITTDRDPQTGLYNEFVGTWGYKVFANETVMIARSMDMRGEHREAERYLEPMLHFQGSEPLTGRFTTKEGVLHGAGPYTHGQYAMNHGFVLWGVADHYLMTRDRAYLERVAPKLVKGCDFLIDQRKATMAAEGSPRTPVHGLAPASSLEDVIEFQYWFATNAYFHLGMKRVADALADIGHPEAARIRHQAESYRRDIEAAAREAATRAAAVRLRDGRCIPYVPSGVHQWRHLTTGWIREALYCSLHLGTTEVVSWDDPLMTWMLDELEDNIFFSGASGYGLSEKDVGQYWFERGGLTPQPCLLDTPLAYLARNEIPAALRSFWNTYALLIYPDVECFAEWAPALGRGGGPLYKTSDESRFIMWLRQLLVWEDGDRLWLGRGTPRAWLEDGKTVRLEQAPTMFGVAGLVIRSEAQRGRLLATVSLPTRNPPSEVWLRLRHPAGKRPARVFLDDIALDPQRLVGEDVRVWPADVKPDRPVNVRAEYTD